MFKSLKGSPITSGLALIFFLFAAGLVCYILLSTAHVVLTHDAQAAVVTECKGSWGRSAGRPAGTYVYAPVAHTPSGEMAVGTKRLSNKSWCERLIGTQTTIYINPALKGKNTYGGFLDFWLGTALIITFGASIIQRRWAAPVVIGGALVCGAALAHEFSAFGINGPKENVLLTPEGRFAACIKKHMSDEGVSNVRDLKKLVCYTPTDLDALWEMHQLETLRVVKVDMANLNSLATLPNLKHLSLAHIPNLTDFSGLEKFPKLESMLLHNLSLNSIRDIPDLKNLYKLRLWTAGSLVDLDGIQRFDGMRELEIDRNTIADISAVSDLSVLEYFMGKNEPFTDISALANKPALRTARFSNTKVTDFSPLFGLPKLFYSGASGVTVPCEQMEQLRASLTRKPNLWLPKHCK